MGARISAQKAGETIWDFLAEVAADGATRPEILHHTGLTDAQFGNGLAYLKDVLQEQNSQPVAITVDHRYVLTEYLAEAHDHFVSAIRGLTTRLRRTGHGTSAYVMKWQPLDGRLLQKQVDRVIEDLDDVLTLMGEP